jgi:biphenyl-2,3-diol 1,2-dioxygenase/3,4-dihydroxy-9,10-secoandrosta-1,3,5(10)-triene-9,17-dione 4,5-dioxygenase
MGFGISDTDAWRAFATDFLGFQLVERKDGAVDCRMDDYAFRIRLHPDGLDDVLYMGWEVADAEGLDALRHRLRTAGVEFAEGSSEQAAERHVHAFIRFNDPDGLQLEAFYGPLQRTNAPFVSPLGVRFLTGEQGLGHAVLIVKDRAVSEAWYRDVLGFRLSDYINAELPGGFPLSFTFMRCNPRHHSIAFCALAFPKRMQHFMVEVDSIDDLGRSIYRAQEQGRHNSLTFGRHSNDLMLSSYYATPSGFEVEYGYGGLAIDEDSWHVRTHDAPSAWGHKFQIPSA